MGETHGPPKLLEGYRLDLASDPDAPALRRPDGSVVACLGAKRTAAEAGTYNTQERERKAGGWCPGLSPAPIHRVSELDFSHYAA